MECLSTETLCSWKFILGATVFGIILILFFTKVFDVVLLIVALLILFGGCYGYYYCSQTTQTEKKLATGPEATSLIARI